MNIKYVNSDVMVQFESCVRTILYLEIYLLISRMDQKFIYLSALFSFFVYKNMYIILVWCFFGDIVRTK